MLAGELVHIMQSIRLRSPRTIRSALDALEEALGDIYGVEACVFDIPSERTLYVTRWPSGFSREKLSGMLRLPGSGDYRWVVLNPGGSEEVEGTGDMNLSVLRVPLLMESGRFGVLSMIKREANAFGNVDQDTFSALSEVLSFLLLPFAAFKRLSRNESREESLRAELLEAVGDELMMRGVMLRMIELSQAEFCALYTESDAGYFYVMLDGKELSPCVPEIRKKLRTAYGMFKNSHGEKDILHEKIYMRRREENVTYLLGSSKIESYFLIPVTFDNRVRGVLFFGSVKKDAFVREDIARFRRLADETDERTPLVFRVGGEIGIMERVLNAFPFGGALISNDGRIVCMNGAFGTTLDTHGYNPETIRGVSDASPFSLQGVWEEFRVLRRNIVDRELFDMAARRKALAVTWIGLGNLAEDVDSLVLVKDITRMKDREEAREEMLATVAHELRTPMTALRNSLKIIMESLPGDGTVPERDRYEGGVAGVRFLKTAFRTTDRLNMLVDGLVDVSTFRIPGRPLKLEDVDVKSFLEDASTLFVESMKKKGIQFEFLVDDAVSTLVFDRDRMEQVIQNLLSNSLKNVPSGGRISISVESCGDAGEIVFPLIPWKYLAPPRFARMRVSDTGGGIPTDTADEINRASVAAGVKRRPARGLGLYISSFLMRRHGGALVIERGGGAAGEVCLYLPTEAETGRVIRTVRKVEEYIDGMTGKGLITTFYSIVKRSPRRWREITGGWAAPPVLNPEKEDLSGRGFYLWTLGEDFAIALTAEERMAEDPMLFLHREPEDISVHGKDEGEIVRIGWAVAPGDGKSYAELAAVSLERIDVETVKAL